MRLLSGFLILTGLGLRSAHAENEVEALRREVRELKASVQQLTNVVQQQNRRIDEISGSRSARTEPFDSRRSRDEIEAKTQAEIRSNPSQASTAAAPAGDAEVDSLLNTVNSAPPSPGSTSRSIGLWRYPAGNSTAAKLLPDISAFGSFVGGYFSQDPTGDVGHDPARTGFTLQEIEIALQSVVDPYLRGDIFLSFHEEGVELEEGYITTLGAGLPRGIQFRGGKFYIPFGRQNPKHLHQWSFVDNNLVNKYLLGPEGLNEIGVEMSYLFPIPAFLQIQGTFTNGDNESSFGGTRKQDFLYNGRLSASVDVSPNTTLLMGTSGAFGFNNSAPGNETTLYGGDFYLRWKPSAQTSLSWQTEYILRRMQLPEAWESDGGLYSYVEWQFLKQFRAAFRYDQMGIPVGVVAKEFRLTPAFSFDPSEFSRIRLQYEYDKIANQDPVHAAFLQFQFSMGPHGAHPF
ncbi:MAG TPA: hypothetical protein DF383_00880 [Deltaproteobacteria bacterium]|nr:hypothetical protein [Deltaproteobacteria bacterium]